MVRTASRPSAADDHSVSDSKNDFFHGLLASLLDVPLVQAAQNVVPVAVTAGDKIEVLRQWASGRCLSADRDCVFPASSRPGRERGE